MLMSHERTKGDKTLELLVDLVDDDIAEGSHLPGRLTLPYHLTTLSVMLLGVALLWTSTQISPILSWTLIIGAVTAFGLGATLYYSQTQLIDDNSRLEVFRRICKHPKFKSVDNPRNELLLFALLRISDALPIPLRKAMPEMSSQFTEERLLQLLLEPM